MFKKLKARFEDKVDLMVAVKASATFAGNKVANIARDEATAIIKGMIFKYVIVMNLVFGVVGFILGAIFGGLVF